MKPSFKDKFLKEERITLVENSKVVSDESRLVEICCKYFRNIARNLGIECLTDNNALTIKKP